ncbi:MAG TPA: EAL domain-containing protein, partial [Bauldia sp.]|nr:EAL domain-containing protein [Bauldia sp.]
EALARQVTELAAKTAGCERVNVWLFNDDETELSCIDLYEATPDRHSAGTVLSGKEFGPELKIVKSSRYVNADDPLTDPRTAGYVSSYIKPLGITSMLDVGIRASERNFGLLCFEHVGKPHHWTEDEISFACQLADKIGIAVISRMRRQAEEQIRHSARHDGLTGLANRKAFIEGVHQAIARAERGEKSFAVLYLDLDHFKDVNDTLGHPVGDELLRAVAERLCRCVRKSDLVARFGGDEFALLIEGVRDPDQVADLAAKVIAALNEPYRIAESDIKSGASIGIAVRETGESDPELLLSNADIALYRAKSEGRGSYRFFTEAMDSEVRARVTMSAELRRAIDADELFLEYQPQVDLETGRIVGVEALVRWRHPVRGVLAPGEFIPVAEQTGLIAGIDGWVLREVCRQGKAWVDEGIAPDTIGLNMSAVSLKRAAEVERLVLATLSETGLPPEKLEIEITESGFMMVSRENEAVLSRLRGKGIKFAIDDFGTGYSSLGYLRRFPVYRLKIAQVFIARIVADPGSEAIVRAAIGLAHELGMVPIAEGVESEEQLAMVSACGCTEVQGYYFSRPRSPEGLHPVLNQGMILLRDQPARTAA